MYTKNNNNKTNLKYMYIVHVFVHVFLKQKSASCSEMIKNATIGLLSIIKVGQ